MSSSNNKTIIDECIEFLSSVDSQVSSSAAKNILNQKQEDLSSYQSNSPGYEKGSRKMKPM